MFIFCVLINSLKVSTIIKYLTILEIAHIRSMIRLSSQLVLLIKIFNYNEKKPNPRYSGGKKGKKSMIRFLLYQFSIMWLHKHTWLKLLSF